MKRSEGQFDINQLQSRWAIIFIILKFLTKLLRQLWPILLALFLGRSGGGGFEKYEIIASSIGIFGMFSSILAYFRYYYRISDEELIIEKGIFKKVKLNLPFERIQSINFHQNFLHQILNVTAVEIESAGSEQKELKIDALKIEVAEQLRKILLEKKAESSISELRSSETVDTVIEDRSNRILQLSIQQLLKVGLVQNHLKPIGLLFSLGGSLFVYGYTIGMDPFEIFQKVRHNIFNVSSKDQLIWVLVLIPLMIIYSVVTTILRHYNLDFSRSGKRFHVVQGLINKQQFSALDRKIQIMSWSQNPLERSLGFFRIFFRQAKSGDTRKEKMRFEIPGCEIEQVEQVKSHWIGAGRGQFSEFKGISFHFFRRSAIYQCILYAIILALLIAVSSIQWIALWVLWWAFSLYMTWKEYKKKSYALNDKEMFVGGGILGFKNSIFPIHKIQNIAIQQNPYQWRRDLATLNIYTSAGKIKIPYIKEYIAMELMDLLIYKVECSKKSWM